MPCGRRTKLRDIFLGTFKNYIVKFSKGIFNVTTLKESSDNDRGQDKEFIGLTEEEKNLNKNRGDKCQITPQGCGNKLDWSRMEDVTDKVNQQLKDAFLEAYDNKITETINSVKIDIFNDIS